MVVPAAHPRLVVVAEAAVRVVPPRLEEVVVAVAPAHRPLLRFQSHRPAVGEVAAEVDRRSPCRAMVGPPILRPQDWPILPVGELLRRHRWRPQASLLSVVPTPSDRLEPRRRG